MNADYFRLCGTLLPIPIFKNAQKMKSLNPEQC
jgi:hypothetical protein